MPRSGLPIVAIIGLAVIYPIGDHCGAQTGNTDSQQQQSETKPIDLAPIKNALDSLASTIKTLKDNPDAASEKERAERDLKAQEAMARWAERLLWATVASLILTVAGIVLIWRTLVHTRRAADASDEMVRQGQETTRAAVYAAETAAAAYASDRETAEAQIQPHLVFSDGRLAFGNNQLPWVYVTIANVGNSTAEDAWLYVSDGEESITKNTDKNLSGHGVQLGTIRPGPGLPARTQLPKPIDFSDGTPLALRVELVVAYRGKFDRELFKTKTFMAIISNCSEEGEVKLLDIGGLKMPWLMKSKASQNNKT